uniref:NADH-ubiquinone oxidoreductase chain 2 n=1 Tax=Gasterophilus intestinalis TaxID=84525 RepID=A0A142I0M8_GASIN|nr:NADH dehydrogenase subunit 2 [Gasterophilus intestinalis]AMR35660.1 NADH dehydrogenase subunit 2 [Gasterophilus intestinalis]AMR35673.1 NADH dehydrogenase subunit 2 [Gasterophilus intestinalis]QCG71515.1 NADH dehydrogenase subunit 2 [Gasterophilus intestinalis]
MFNSLSKIMFFSMLVLGTLITISANSWLSAWMGLEINLLSFIPLMSDNKLMSTEASLKYFLTQAMASAVLLFALTSLFMSFMNNSFSFLKMIIFFSLLMKSGSAPFHFWYPMVMEGLSWMNALILMTWQKIAPLMLISYVILKPLFIMTIILSSLVGALGGLNQTSLRKLMAYSSINHLGWMLVAIYSSNFLWVNYFLFYAFLSFTLILMFNEFKISHINQLFSSFFNSKIMKFIVFLNLLSLGGLPPFLGFFPKWMIIQSLSANMQIFLLTFMVMMTLITLYFYLRLCYTAFMLNYSENNWLTTSFYFNSHMILFMACSFISVFGLFFTTSLYFIY